MNQDLTQGSVKKNLIRFGMPFLFTYILQSVYSMVDMLIVSYFAGTYSISGVNISGQIMQLVLGIGTGMLQRGILVLCDYGSWNGICIWI